MIIDKEIIQTVAERLGISIEDIDRYSNFREELGLGPIELNDLLQEIAQKYNMVFDPEDIDQLQTIGDLINLVEDNLLE